ncbi:bacteriocin class II family protein [Ekhidna sp.]
MKNLQELKTEELTKVEGGSWYPWDWCALILEASEGVNRDFRYAEMA